MDSPVLNVFSFFLICCLLYLGYDFLFVKSQTNEEIKVISEYYDGEDVIKIEKLGDNKYLVFTAEKGSKVYKEEIFSFSNKNKPVIENVYIKE